MTLTKETMETIIAPKDHIVDARKMAEGIFRKAPHLQREMLEELNKHLEKQWEIMLEELRQK